MRSMFSWSLRASEEGQSTTERKKADTDKRKDKNETGSCDDRWGPDRPFSPQPVTERVP